MGQETFQRARRADQRQQRRDTILDAAAELFAEHTYNEVKVSQVARRAGVAKGTVFLYFDTKEALFLDLAERELFDWLDELDRALDTGQTPWSGERYTRYVVNSLSDRTTLKRLLTLMSNVLEHNVTVEHLVETKTAFMVRLEQTAKRLERRIPFLGPMGGLVLLLRSYALVVGLGQMSDPCATAYEAMKRPRLELLLIDFDRELYAMLSALLIGMEAQARTV